MILTCPSCQTRYRIDPKASKAKVARVKCPGCEHTFEVSLAEETSLQNESTSPVRPVVLIVDDARFFREMIKDILSELPVELDDSADGNEAWQKITASKPQLVLLDLNIPGKNGREILKALQQNAQLDSVKVLAMSGVERGEETASEVRRIGATDFISKSFKPRELQKRVRDLLAL
jgi:predicted Zn finger-like uncharacterized protein